MGLIFSALLFSAFTDIPNVIWLTESTCTSVLSQGRLVLSKLTTKFKTAVICTMVNWIKPILHHLKKVLLIMPVTALFYDFFMYMCMWSDTQVCHIVRHSCLLAGIPFIWENRTLLHMSTAIDGSNFKRKYVLDAKCKEGTVESKYHDRLLCGHFLSATYGSLPADPHCH